MAGGEQVYATLLLSDSYLPGALVLAHSLRDARTTKKLAVLVTLDTVSADAITRLKNVYDYVLPVPRIRNEQPSNLYLMNRADLHSAFTKINLWRQGQFSRVVYIDADVVAYRAPDELFEIPHAFAAAPDIGWPDIFNTGVMVLTPNMGDYYAMLAMAERGISFDGADQGLLNMHFKNSFHRLSFTYNVTPSAHYQYVPAYRHFQSSINMVHFIGSNKPWFSGRHAPHGMSPFDEMVGRWWAVYDRHYRTQETRGRQDTRQPSSSLVQYYTQGEWTPQRGPVRSDGQQQQQQQQQQHYRHSTISETQTSPGHRGDLPRNHAGHVKDTSVMDFADQASPNVTRRERGEGAHESCKTRFAQTVPEQSNPDPVPIPMADWDAQWQPPPVDSKPEAINFPSAQYTMSNDPAPFVPPPRYPSPPKNMWYEVPKEPPAPAAQPPKPVFPWEGSQPRPSRTFPRMPDPRPRSGSANRPQVSTASVAEGLSSAPFTPPTPTVRVHPPPAESWTSFQLNNAWDDIPEIGRYVEGLQKHRRVKSQGSAAEITSPMGQNPLARGNKRSPGLRLTDFPSETERPSLPVTPAPVARPTFWGSDEPEASGERKTVSNHKLPAAEGVPAQSEWDPDTQLQKLAKQQYEHLLRKLGGEGEEGGENGAEAVVRVIPKRSLPFGSEPIKSPTYIAQFALAPKPAPADTALSSGDGGSVAITAAMAPISAAEDDTSIAAASKASPSRSPDDKKGTQLLESPIPRVQETTEGANDEA